MYEHCYVYIGYQRKQLTFLNIGPNSNVFDYEAGLMLHCQKQGAVSESRPTIL